MLYVRENGQLERQVLECAICRYHDCLHTPSMRELHRGQDMSSSRSRRISETVRQYRGLSRNSCLSFEYSPTLWHMQAEGSRHDVYLSLSWRSILASLLLSLPL